MPSSPPFLAVEVLSPKDRPQRIKEKLDEYLRWGVKWIWVVDPYAREALVYTKDPPDGSLATTHLHTDDPRIEVSLAALFAKLPAPGIGDQPSTPSRSRLHKRQRD